MEKQDAKKKAEVAQALRARLGFKTQEDFAKALRVSISTVQKWERGVRTPSRLAQQAIDRLERTQGKEPASAVA